MFFCKGKKGEKNLYFGSLLVIETCLILNNSQNQTTIDLTQKKDNPLRLSF